MKTHSDSWFDPEHPPWGECYNAGNGVWYFVDKDGKLMLWHWCNRRECVALDKKNNVESGEGLGQRDPSWYEPQWVLVGTEAHELTKGPPPTLHPSVLWNYCCNKHGYLEQGKWRDV